MTTDDHAVALNAVTWTYWADADLWLCSAGGCHGHRTSSHTRPPCVTLSCRPRRQAIADSCDLLDPGAVA